MKASRVLLWVCLVMASASAVTAEVSIVGAPGRITIDGNLKEWARAPSIILDEKKQVAIGANVWEGPADCSGKFQFMWDVDNYYIAATITDEVPLMNDKLGGDIWAGDGIEFYVGTEGLPETAAYTEHEFQSSLSAGPTPATWCYQNDAEIAGAEISVVTTDTGYIIEAKVPWSTFGGYTPKEGDVIGFDIGVNDDDKVPSGQVIALYLSEAEETYLNPSVWAEAILGAVAAIQPQGKLTTRWASIKSTESLAD